MKPPHRRALFLAGIVLASVAACAVAMSQGWINQDSLRGISAVGTGPEGKLLYIVAVVVMELLWMPRAWGLLAGGALFGPAWGAGLSMVGDLLGGALTYALGRGLARQWAEQAIARRPGAERVLKLLAHRHGGTTVALLRVCPVAHYTLSSYAAGMAGVRPLPYMVGTAVGILPAALLYPLMGHAAITSPGSPLFWIASSLVLVFIGVTVVLSRRLLRR